MNLPKGFLDELRARVGIAEVIGKRVRLIRRGRQYLGLCPFHGEKTPSFHVWEDHYHCFGCGAHGSVIDFVMQSDKIGFREAVERVALLAGLTLPQTTAEELASERRRGTLVDVLETAARYYTRMLRMPEGKTALSYLQKRGLSDSAIEHWRLGYAPESGQAVKAALGREGIDEAALLECGLLVQPEEGGRTSYDRFRGRVMFPIADRRGRVLGFGGRLLGPGEPKYLNSPETGVFHKGRLLYGIDHAAAAARSAGTIIVVEGYMDVIGLAEAGWQHVVAPLGTALTEEQLRALWAIAPEPILLFDPDAAGERAALRAAERALPMLKPGLGLRIALLRVDTKDDPDRIAARWPAQVLHRTLQEAAPLSDFLFRVENKGRLHVPPEERAAVEERLRRRADAITDRSVRTNFQRAFRERTWQAMRGRSGKSGRGALHASLGIGTPPLIDRVGSMQVADTAWAPSSQKVAAEKSLLRLICRHPQLFNEIEEELGSLSFSDAELDKVRQALVGLLSGWRGQCDENVIRCKLEAQGLGMMLDRIMPRRLVGLRTREAKSLEDEETPVLKMRNATLEELQEMRFEHEKDEICRLGMIKTALKKRENGDAEDNIGQSLDHKIDSPSDYQDDIRILRRFRLREELSAWKLDNDVSTETWEKRRALLNEVNKLITA